ncbi:MAG: hypothetical protein JXR76_09115 [Deltaproteobacteria bacterium]|nr:hypothetical protein [Deltaproteobacteria bacterium]
MNQRLVQSLLKDLANPDSTVASLHVFRHWVVACVDRVAVVSIPEPATDLLCPGNTDISHWLGRPVRDVVAEGFASREVVHRAAAMACLNAGIREPQKVRYGDAMAHFAECVITEPSCFIGHFETAAMWRQSGYPVTIVELAPRAGDIHWNDADEPLKNASLVFLTGLTLLNGTFHDVVKRTPNARARIIVGPTVPVSARLFEFGIHAAGGTEVCDANGLMSYLQHGGTSMKKAPAGAVRHFNIIQPEIDLEVSHVA